MPDRIGMVTRRSMFGLGIAVPIAIGAGAPLDARPDSAMSDLRMTNKIEIPSDLNNGASTSNWIERMKKNERAPDFTRSRPVVDGTNGTQFRDN